MRTVNQLIAAGFVVRQADNADAVDCTEVRSAKPFWSYNPRWTEVVKHAPESHARAVLSALDPAVAHEGGFRMLVAGIYAGDTGFPFELIDQERKALLEKNFSTYQEHANLAGRALDDFHDALNVGEPYAA